MGDFWRLYAETHLERSTRGKYRCLWSCARSPRLRSASSSSNSNRPRLARPTIRSCLGLLQSMFARAVEWDRASVNVVKLIAKPRAPRVRAIKPLRPVVVEALRRQMLCNHDHGLRYATLVSVLAYAGLRPEEVLALEYQDVRKATILVEQKWIDGEIVPCPARRPPALRGARRCAMHCAAIRVDGHSAATLLTHAPHRRSAGRPGLPQSERPST